MNRTRFLYVLVFVVGTGSLPVRLSEVKAFGKKQMPAADWARGVRVESGARFGPHGG